MIPKHVQHISNMKGTDGKSPLNPMILAAIKGTCNCALHNIYLRVFMCSIIPFRCPAQGSEINYLKKRCDT